MSDRISEKELRTYIKRICKMAGISFSASNYEEEEVERTKQINNGREPFNWKVSGSLYAPDATLSISTENRFYEQGERMIFDFGELVYSSGRTINVCHSNLDLKLRESTHDAEPEFRTYLHFGSFSSYDSSGMRGEMIKVGYEREKCFEKIISILQLYSNICGILTHPNYWAREHYTLELDEAIKEEEKINRINEKEFRKSKFLDLNPKNENNRTIWSRLFGR